MRFVFGFALIFLAACAPEEDTVDRPAPDAVDALCPEREMLLTYVGGPVTAFDIDGYGKPVRLVPPGALVTQEYLPQRLNIETDAAGVITRFWCG